MQAWNKKCPMCAETIPLAASVCEYCGTRFEVNITGYCPTCHQVRSADVNGCCQTCNGEVIDPRVESRMVEDPASVQSITETVQSPVRSTPGRRKTWFWVGGIVVILGLAALAWDRGLKLAPVFVPASATPTVTHTATLRASPVPTSTRTPRPTPTITPIPAWVGEFGAPILKAVQDRSPDLVESFTDLEGWYVASGPNTELSNLEIVDGWLQVNATSIAGGEFEIGMAYYSPLRYNNFVLEVDADMSILDPGDMLAIEWRRSRNRGVIFNIYKGGEWQLRYTSDISDDLWLSGSIARIPDKVTIRIISRGTEHAIYLDENPIGYYDDDIERIPAKTIRLGLEVLGSNHADAVRFDNLKVWNLSNNPVP